MNQFARWAAMVIIILSSTAVLADDPTGFGGVATNLMQPIGVFSDFLYTACWVIGGSFFFASIIKYFEHQRSPLMVPMSTVVFLFLAAGVLIALPFLSLSSDDPAIRFSFFDHFSG